MSWHRIASVDDLEDDVPFGTSIGKKQIALVKFDGQVYATSNICTHQYALMSEGYFEDGVIECPLHQGCFDVRTGKALGPPVCEDLETYEVRNENGEIYVNCD